MHWHFRLLVWEKRSVLPSRFGEELFVEFRNVHNLS